MSDLTKFRDFYVYFLRGLSRFGYSGSTPDYDLYPELDKMARHYTGRTLAEIRLIKGKKR